MKKIIILLSTILVGCSTNKPLSKDEMAKFEMKGDSILYDNIYVAKYLNIEWEYYRGHKTMEISLEQIDGGANAMTDKIVDFIRTKHPKAKAEVKIPRIK